MATERRITNPPASSAAARAVMTANRGRDTGPELAVRRRLHAAGLRYRVDHPLELPAPIGRRRRADVVFTAARVALFIDGCFWHGCPEHRSAPRSNQAFWDAKVHRNKARDRETDRLLTTAGWQPLRFWEHEDPDMVARSVVRAVRRRSD